MAVERIDGDAVVVVVVAERMGVVAGVAGESVTEEVVGVFVVARAVVAVVVGLVEGVAVGLEVALGAVLDAAGIDEELVTGRAVALPFVVGVVEFSVGLVTARVAAVCVEGVVRMAVEMGGVVFGGATTLAAARAVELPTGVPGAGFDPCGALVAASGGASRSSSRAAGGVPPAGFKPPCLALSERLRRRGDSFSA